MLSSRNHTAVLNELQGLPGGVRYRALGEADPTDIKPMTDYPLQSTDTPIASDGADLFDNRFRR